MIVCIYVFGYECMYVSTCVCILELNVGICVVGYVRMYVYVCLYVCMYVFGNVCMYMYVYMYD